MAWTQAEIELLFKYTGHSPLIGTGLPNIQEAFLACQSRADGGTRPDSSLESDMRALMARIARYETMIDVAIQASLVGTDNGSTLTPAKSIMMARDNGQRLCDNICTLAYVPRGDRFFFPKPRTYADA